MVLILFHRSAYPEDHEVYTSIESYHDDKLEAFNKLIDLNFKKNYYTDYFLKEYDEDKIVDKVTKYISVKNFILSNGEVIYHKTNQDLVEKNNNLYKKINYALSLVEEINTLFQSKYNQEMILYREGKIKHPIQKKYDRYSLNYQPSEDEGIKKFENYVNSLIDLIKKEINAINIVF